MGFPVGYKSSFSFKLMLLSFLVLGIILTPILTLLRFLGVRLFKDPIFDSFSEYSTQVNCQTAALVKKLLPVIKFGDVAASDQGTCAICLFEFQAEEEVRWLMNCKHVFHRGCVDRWIIEHHQNSCPLCRALLVPCHMQYELELGM